MSLGEELRRLRGSTPQRSIADQLGISPALLSNYENDYSTPSSKRLMDLVDVYADPEDAEDLYEQLLALSRASVGGDRAPARISKNVLRSIHEVLVEILGELRAARADREEGAKVRFQEIRDRDQG